MTRKTPDFSQRESRIEVTSLSHSLTGFSLETWLAAPRRARTETTGIITYRDGSQWYGLFLETTRTTGHLRFVLGSGPTATFDAVTANEPFSTWSQTWRHVAVSYDGANAAITLDGQAAATTAATGGTTIIPVQRGLVFGSYFSGTRRRRFRGRLAEVRLWNLIRTPAEIDNGRFCPLTQTDSIDCLGYWPLDEGFGTIANDRTTATNNGTLYDIPGWADWDNNVGGSFMDDFESALAVKENNQPIPSSGSDWGKATKASKRNLSIANTCSHCDLNITKISTNPAEFTVPALTRPVTLKPRGDSPNSYDTKVSFEPRKPGVRKSRVTVETDRPFYEPYKFSYDLQAEYAEKPSLAVFNGETALKNGQTLAWGKLQIGFSRTVTLKNSGLQDLEIKRVWLDPAAGFALDPANLSTTLAVNGTATFNLNFVGGSGELRTRVNIAIENATTADFSFDITAEEKSTPKMVVQFNNTKPVSNGQHFDLGRMVAGRADVVYTRFKIFNTAQADLRMTIKLTNMNGNFCFKWIGGPELPKKIIPNYRLVSSAWGGFPVGLGFFPRSSAASHVRVEITSNDPDQPNFFFTVNCQGTSSRTTDPGWRDGTVNLGNGGRLTLAAIVSDNDIRELTANGPAFTPPAFNDVVVGTTTFVDFSMGNAGSDFMVMGGQPQLVGGNSSEFTLGQLNILALAHGGHIQIPLSLTPTSPGVKTARLRFTWGGGQVAEYTISGTARD